MTEDAAPVEGGVGTDLRNQFGVHEGHIQGVPAAPRGGKPAAFPGMAGIGRGHVAPDQACHLGTEWCRAADRAEVALGVAAAQQEELGSDQDAGDRSDDRLCRVAAAQFVPASVPGPVGLVHGFDHDAFDPGDVGPRLQPLLRLDQVRRHRAHRPGRRQPVPGEQGF